MPPARDATTPRGRVLVLAYHFPPLGGAGVQRILQLARRLPELGWDLRVITGPGDPESHWRPLDNAVGPGGPGVDVHRLEGPEPPHDVRWEGRLERWLRLSSRWRRWWSEHVVRLAASLGDDVGLVHASVAPYSTAESALAVARRLRRPLVIDLEDPWALDEMMVYPSRVHRLLERRRMARVLRQADAVVMNTEEARRRVLATFRGLDERRVVAIANAFDRSDFEGGRPPERHEGRFRIVHTGSLHTAMGQKYRAAGLLRRLVGGVEPGVDFLTRSHVFLLRAIESLFAEEPDLASVLEVHLAGVFTAEDRAVAAPHSFVHLHEFLPHAETVALLRSADLLFLPMHDLHSGARAGIVPHKTYEYVAAGRPILGAVPDGDARDVLEASGVARLCRPDDVNGMAAAIRAEVDRWRRGEPAPTPAPELMARCEATRLASQFSDLYTRVAAGVRSA